MFGVMRTGVRVVMTNPADPRRVEDYAAWYDAYGAALAHPDILRRTGQVIGAEAAVEYGFRDVNGKQPPSRRDQLRAPPAYSATHERRRTVPTVTG